VKDVPETAYKTVTDHGTRDCPQTVCKTVTETCFKQVRRTVCKDVCETVCKPVTKTVCEPVCTTKAVCKTVPETACETVCVKGRLRLARVPVYECAIDPCSCTTVQKPTRRMLCRSHSFSVMVPVAMALIGELEAALESFYPRASRHGLNVGQLISQSVAFFVLLADGQHAGHQRPRG